MQVLGWVYSLDNVGFCCCRDVTSQPHLGVVRVTRSPEHVGCSAGVTCCYKPRRRAQVYEVAQLERTGGGPRLWSPGPGSGWYPDSLTAGQPLSENLSGLESPLDCKEIQTVPPKGDQSWVFIGRTDVEAETHLKRP